jgi:galactofuranosylgalactofuranosylrhamnosyl-N-acetylglucosaminyl-diphospho-decaprenol beta-1,5/1,6-galactofuranosyltransferase
MEMSGAKSLYFRLNDHAQFIYSEKEIILAAGGKADFTAYFNQFSVNKWKHYTEILDVELLIEFEGEALLTVVINQHEAAEAIVLEKQLSSADGTHCSISLPSFKYLPNGLISFRVHSLSCLTFKSASFVTRQSPIQNVHLGIAITAFKRDECVIPAINRLTQELVEDPDYKGKVKLTVVDNGGTLIDKNIPSSCRVIQNRNLGGSGGFARGLLHYDEECEGITHCLFMDDDASCDSEAIKRTIAFLGYAKSTNTAIAGAMMLEGTPTMQHENGAIFDQHCIPLKNSLNLSSARNLKINDLIEPIMYGAWWFFAFPLKHVERYPFPFFVRGDDVAFSCANSFEIATLNGISSLQQPFAEKESPMTVYLDTRQNIVQYLLFQDLKYPVVKILRKFWRTFIKFNSAYHYSTAEAVCIALQDTLRPASFWAENVDMQDKRGELSTLIAREKLRSMPQQRNSIQPTPRESKAKKILRWSTLNGHLIPKFFMRKQARVNKITTPLVKAAFFRKELLVYHSSGASGFILSHDKFYFFSNIIRAIKLSMQTIALSKELKSRKHTLVGFMDSEFWVNQFYHEAKNDTKK